MHALPDADCSDEEDDRNYSENQYMSSQKEQFRPKKPLSAYIYFLLRVQGKIESLTSYMVIAGYYEACKRQMVPNEERTKVTLQFISIR
jgi:hypothetical protein